MYFICLATLLLQLQLPAMILLDEPELGLHPAAIAILAALLERCAWKSQILAATQSVTQVWIVDRVNGASIFRHLAHEEVEAWIDGYALGELWERNVFGGRP